MGSNTKLNVQFTDRHWETLGATGESYADTGYQASWDVSRGQPGQSGILVNYTGGNVSDSFSSGTPASRASQFLTQVEPVMPGLTAKWNGRATIDYNLPVAELGEGAAIRINAMAHVSNVAGRDEIAERRWGLAPSLALGLGTPTRLTLGYLHEDADDIPDYGIPWYFEIGRAHV